MRIIAVVNQKGGVGKTTTSVNLGAALAKRGQRVLLVDMDPQGNLTDHLLGDPPDGRERASIYDVLVEGKGVLACVVPTTTAGLSVLPSHEDLAGAELDLASVIGREVILKDALAEVPADAFDWVFLDCPPSLGLLSLNALAAADEVFIALQTEFFAMRGLGALDRTVDLVRRRINPRLRVGGIVPTLVDATRLSREVTDEVRAHYGPLLFESKIRTNIRLAEAPSHGRHIFDYAPDSPGAADYAALAEEVCRRDLVAAAAVDPAAVDPAAAAPAATALPGGVSVGAAAAPPAAEHAPDARRAGGRRGGIAAAIAEAVAAATGSAGARGATASTASPPSPRAAAAPRPPVPAPGSEPARRASVPLPVLRSGPRPLSLAPMPTRPPSALPRPATGARSS